MHTVLLYLCLIVFLCIYGLYPHHTYGQNQTSNTIASILQENCLFEQEYIDTCPNHREELSSINNTLYEIRAQQEENALSKSDMLQTLEKQKALLQQVDIALFQRGERTKNKEFLIQYMLHLISLYREHIEQPGSLE